MRMPIHFRPTLPITVALLIAVLSVTGCVSSSGSRTGSPGTVYPKPQPTAPSKQPAPPPVQTPTVRPPVALAPPPAPPSYPKSADEISSQAVVSLMSQASKARAEGKYDQASSALERAVKIEPRNYFVWSALGRVYLDKKLYDNAESIALKANSLARGNIYVELENWKVISEARDALGDSVGALQALSKIDEIERSLNLAGG